jgi:4-hydroxybenzoate polyprenyltransferase
VTSIAERVQLDDITAQAHQVRFGRLLLTVLAAVFFAIGWTFGRLFFGLAWCGVAVKVGFQAGRAHGPARTD